jgi:hypothetical protein
MNLTEYTMTIEQSDISSIIDEIDTVVREYAQGNLTKDVAGDLLDNIKKTADSKGIPVEINRKNMLDSVKSANNYVDPAEEFDDEEDESSSDEYSEDEYSDEEE